MSIGANVVTLPVLASRGSVIAAPSDFDDFIYTHNDLNHDFDPDPAYASIANGQLSFFERCQGLTLRTFGPGASQTIADPTDVTTRAAAVPVACPVQSTAFGGHPCWLFARQQVGLRTHPRGDLFLNATEFSVLLTAWPTYTGSTIFIGATDDAGVTSSDLSPVFGFSNSGSNNQIPRFLTNAATARTFFNHDYSDAVHFFLWTFSTANGTHLYVDSGSSPVLTASSVNQALTDGRFQLGRTYEASSIQTRMAKGLMGRTLTWARDLSASAQDSYRIGVMSRLTAFYAS